MEAGDTGPGWPSAFEPGTIFGAYEILGHIGTGGMGSVYRAHHRQLDRDVALKVLSPSLIQPQAIDRFRLEGVAASRIKHPNVVEIYDAGHEHGNHFIAMELLLGRTLDRIFVQDGLKSIEFTIDLLLPVFSAVMAGHAVGVIHRDIKPGNIVVVQRDGVLVPKVLDFGISKVREAQPAGVERTMRMDAMGTLAYMSPEQAAGSPHIDERTDQYNLALVAIECLTGRPVHGGTSGDEILRRIASRAIDPPTLYRKEISAELENRLLCALEYEPQRRYARVSDFADALLPFASSATREAWGKGEPRFFAPLASSSAASPVGRALPSPSGPDLARRPLGATMVIPGANLVDVESAKAAPRPAAPVIGPVPNHLSSYTADITRFLTSLFGRVLSGGDGVVELSDPQFSQHTSDQFLAVFLSESNQIGEGAPLGTRTFLSCASPLVAKLRRFDRERRKIVLAIADFDTLGKGARERLIHLERAFNALVVPCWVVDIRRALGERRERKWFESRFIEFHSTHKGGVVEPERYIGMGAEQRDIVRALAQPGSGVLLSGLPGAGKTSLIAQAEYSVEDTVFETISGRAFSGRLGAFATQLAKAIPLAGLPKTDRWRAIRAGDVSFRGPEPHEVNHRVVLVLEDVDWIIAGCADGQRQSEPCRAFLDFLAEVLAAKRARLLLSGVHTYLLKLPEIDGWRNPLYDKVTLVRIGGIDALFGEELVNQIGTQLNFAFSRRMMRRILRECHGNIDLVRKLCSLIAARYHAAATESAGRRAMSGARADIESALDTLASDQRLFDGFAWLTLVERKLLAIVARDAPRNPVHAMRGVPREATTPPGELERAFLRCQQLQLIERDRGRERIAVPLARRWILRNVEPPPESPRRAVPDALIWACVVAAAIVIWRVPTQLMARVARRSITIDDVACSYRLDLPAAIFDGAPVTLLATRTSCAGRSGPEDIRLLPSTETQVDLHGAIASEIPLRFSCRDPICLARVDFMIHSAPGGAELSLLRADGAIGAIRLEASPVLAALDFVRRNGWLIVSSLLPVGFLRRRRFRSLFRRMMAALGAAETGPGGARHAGAPASTPAGEARPGGAKPAP